MSIDPETGLLFVGDFSGFVHCLDAETGKLYWTHDMKAHMWGSTLVADGKVYVGDEDGDFVVLAASKEKKMLSETNLGAPVYSTPWWPTACSTLPPTRTSLPSRRSWPSRVAQPQPAPSP